MRVAAPYKQSNSVIPYILSADSPLVSDEVADSKKMGKVKKFKKLAEQAAHDIRTPLQTLSMALDYRFKNLTEEEHMLLNKLIDKIRKIAQLFLDSGKKEESADRRNIQISQALAEVVEQKEIQYIGKNVEFQYSFDPAIEFTFIHGNALNFERMMSNLINNSVEAFDGKKGIVKVSFTTDKDNVKITIQDNGIGMPQEMVNKFTRGDSVSSTKVDGHGIGTQQIRDALAELGGTQLIESTLGVGTKITLTIPKSSKPKDFIDNATIETCHDSSPADVVLLDDSWSFVEILGDFLQSNGIKKVDTYCNPDDLLKNLSKYSVDTKIFTDNDFKCHISGEDLVRQLTILGFKNLHILSGSPTKNLRSKYPDGIKFIEKGSETFMDDLIYYAKKVY